MKAQRDDVKIKGARKTWTRLCRVQTELVDLWRSLFTMLATDAGLPAPSLQQAGIASYADEKHAAVLAERLQAELGVEAIQFTVGGNSERPARYCVSLM